MFAVEFTDKLADEVIEVVQKKLEQRNYGTTVSRREAMTIIGTSEATFNEIRKREDFRFVHIEGVPNRYSTENLIKWINGERKVTR